jgi:hypothetical protein
MPRKGYKQTEEHKRKCGDIRKGKKQSKEHIRKRVLSYKGKKLSKEHIQKLIIARNKRPLLSEETKRKIGKSIKKLWDDPNSVFYSEEFRINRGEVNKGELNPCYGKYKERNPHWKGGSNEYWHKQAWELFGYDCCENCYMSNEEHKIRWKKRLEMHNTLEPKDYKIMEPEAWMTLCKICHKGLEVVLENERRWLKNYTKNKIS